MEELEYLFHVYEQSHISAAALDSALRVLNSPTKELAYVLQLYDQKHIGGTALEYALRVPALALLKEFLQLHEHDRIGDEALDSALLVLRPYMDVEEMSYESKQEEEIKEEPYDEPWCTYMPAKASLVDEPKHIKIFLLENYE